MAMLEVNVNSVGASKTKPAPTHWSNAFQYRRRATATADAKGKPLVTLNADLLEMIGVKVGEDVIMTVNNVGQLVVVRPEVQLTD